MALFQLRKIFDFEKWFPFDIFGKDQCIGFKLYTQAYNHKM